MTVCSAEYTQYCAKVLTPYLFILVNTVLLRQYKKRESNILSILIYSVSLLVTAAEREVSESHRLQKSGV